MIDCSSSATASRDRGAAAAHAAAPGRGEEGRAQEILGALDRVFNQGQQGAKVDLNKIGSEAISQLLFAQDPMQLAKADEQTARTHYQEVAAAILSVRKQQGVITDWQQVTKLRR